MRILKMNDIQTIFTKHGTLYMRNYKLPINKLKAINSIISCRTSSLGGHIYKCDSCGETKIVYNSCRNRHCPKCQALAREKWVNDRRDDLLPIKYFHAVFTIPS